MRLSKPTIRFLLLLCAIAPAVFFSACDSQTKLANLNSVSPIMRSTGPVSLVGPTPLSGAICNPFSGSVTAGSPGNGLLASWSYIPAQSPVVTTLAGNPPSSAGLSVSNFFPGQPDVAAGTLPVFLNQLDATEAGLTGGFRGPNGEPITEFFSLRMTGKLGLNFNEVEDDYDLALLASDGAVLSINASGSSDGFESILDDDGVHPPRLGCSHQSVHLVPGVPISIRIDYFHAQGSRVSLALFWRPSSKADVFEPDCNPSQPPTPDFFFTSDATGSQPTSNFTALTQRGWRIVPSGNLYLPGDSANPCAEK